MKEWELMISKGREAYSSEEFKHAIDINQNALKEASSLFDVVFDAEPERAVAAVVISYFNLADAYIALKSWSTAQQTLEQASAFLQQQFSLPYLSDPQQVALLHAASHLRIEWASLIQKIEQLTTNPALSTPGFETKYQP